MPPPNFMEGIDDVAVETLKAPEEIRRSITRPENVRLYYRRVAGTPIADKRVSVVANISGRSPRLFGRCLR